jgi:hypothetical protein
MTEASQEGFASHLLARARGESSQLRPKLQPYYAPDTEEAAPLIEEVTQEARAEAPRRPLEVPEPARAQALHLGRAPDGGTRTTNHPVPSPSGARLMPKDSDAPPAPPPSPDVETPNITVDDEVRAPAMEPEERPSSAPAVVQPAPTEGRSAPGVTASLAAAIVRLGGESPNTEPRLMPEESVATGAAHLVRPESPAPRDDATTLPPLHIHIDEIVIAADPAPAEARPEPPRPRPTWQPMLSLDAYRAGRQRGER